MQGMMNPPALVTVGDWDDPAFIGYHLICHHAPNASTIVLSVCSQPLNLEELDFFQSVYRGPPRGRGRRPGGLVAKLMPPPSPNETSEKPT